MKHGDGSILFAVFRVNGYISFMRTLSLDPTFFKSFEDLFISFKTRITTSTTEGVTDYWVDKNSLLYEIFDKIYYSGNTLDTARDIMTKMIEYCDDESLKQRLLCAYLMVALEL